MDMVLSPVPMFQQIPGSEFHFGFETFFFLEGADAVLAPNACSRSPVYKGEELGPVDQIVWPTFSLPEQQTSDG
jgi:hypothetical protein